MRQRTVITGSFLVFSAIIVAGFSLLLHHHGELVLTRNGVTQQLRDDGIYGRSVWDDFYAYKLALLEARPAQTISLGSSRAMSVRASLFRNQDHISMGGAIQSVPELEAMGRDLAALPAPPSNVILFVDFEWFLDTTQKPYENRNRQQTEQWGHLFQSAFVRLPDLLASLVAPQFDRDPVTGGSLIGSRAKRQGDGFRRDGSIRHYGFLTGQRPWPEADMPSILASKDSRQLEADALDFAAKRGWTGARIDQRLLDRFTRQVHKWNNDPKTNIILILPPVAPNAATLLRHRTSMPFYAEWLAAMEALARQPDMPLYDYTDLTVQDPNCWFDRYHASEGGYAWLMARVQQDLAARQHVMAGIFRQDMQQRYPPAGYQCKKALAL